MKFEDTLINSIQPSYNLTKNYIRLYWTDIQYAFKNDYINFEFVVKYIEDYIDNHDSITEIVFEIAFEKAPSVKFWSLLGHLVDIEDKIIDLYDRWAYVYVLNARKHFRPKGDLRGVLNQITAEFDEPADTYNLVSYQAKMDPLDYLPIYIRKKKSQYYKSN